MMDTYVRRWSLRCAFLVQAVTDTCIIVSTKLDVPRGIGHFHRKFKDNFERSWCSTYKVRAALCRCSGTVLRNDSFHFLAQGDARWSRRGRANPPMEVS